MIEYKSMTSAEQETFLALIKTLLTSNIIMRSSINSKTGAYTTNEAYDKCYGMQHMISEYLAFMGVELLHDSRFEMFYIKTAEDRTALSRERSLKKETTYILLALKQMFDDQQSSLEDQYITAAEILEWCDEKGLIVKNINSGLDEILGYLRQKQIIAYHGTNVDKQNTKIYITPAIITVVTQERNTAFFKMLKEMEGEDDHGEE